MTNAYLSAEGTIFDIKRFAVHDGPGIRSTVFISGCPLRCPWCHNPEGLEVTPSLLPHEETAAKTVGRVTVADVIAEVERDQIYYQQSGGGITLGGGDATMQPAFSIALAKVCRERGWHVALDTAGYAKTDLFADLVSVVDMVLFDLKLIDSEEHERVTGVPNAMILANLKYLDSQNLPVKIRFPLIPGITDTEGNIEGILAWLREEVSLRDVSLLPYHRAAQGKYEKLGLSYEMADISPPSSGELEELQCRFSECGFEVRVGA